MTLPNAVQKSRIDGSDALSCARSAQRYLDRVADVENLLLSAVRSLPGVLTRDSFVALTGTGTWTVPANAVAFWARLAGAGAGAGACASAAAGNQSVGSGGSAGATAEAWYTHDLAKSYHYDCGLAGAGGSAGANDGHAGGDTIFDIYKAKGGQPGQHGIDTTSGCVLGGGQPPTGSTGQITGAGESGGFGIIVPGSSGIFVQSGAGGNSFCGRGGLSVGGFSNPGNNGSGFSSGGSGATSYNGGGAQKGGDGTPGVIFVIVFF